jgi:hypothetical protein
MVKTILLASYVNMFVYYDLYVYILYAKYFSIICPDRKFRICMCYLFKI